MSNEDLQQELFLLEAKLLSAQRLSATFEGHAGESLVAVLGDVILELRAIRDRLAVDAASSES